MTQQPLHGQKGGASLAVAVLAGERAAEAENEIGGVLTMKW